MIAGVYMRFPFALALASPCFVLAAAATDANQTNSFLLSSCEAKADKAVKNFITNLDIDLAPNMAEFDVYLDTIYPKFKAWMLFKLHKTMLDLKSKSTLQNKDYEAKLAEKSQAVLDNISQIETNIKIVWTKFEEYEQFLLKGYMAEFRKQQPRYSSKALDDCETYIWYLKYYLEKLDARIAEYKVAYKNAGSLASGHVNDLRMTFESFNERLDLYKWIDNLSLKEKYDLINFDANKVLVEVQKYLKSISTYFKLYFKQKAMYLTSSKFDKSIYMYRKDQMEILELLKKDEASKATASAGDVREMQS